MLKYELLLDERRVQKASSRSYHEHDDDLLHAERRRRNA